jgi:hypothetical protein
MSMLQSIEKNRLIGRTYGFLILLVLIVVSRYGRPILEWLFVKLYEFFIENGALNLSE